MNLEDLMGIQVTSVSKKEQPLSKTGAAVFVITQEDIRRSGATTIPDVLRMAPGVNVARMDMNRYAISIRGFNDRYANKVLVLIDGRSVYNDGFSGVFWDGQAVPLEDIERIEVIRGPGGTVWGANAMNGVINIITSNSQDTRGGLLRAGTGSSTKADALAQFGGKIGRKGAYRAFGSFFGIGGSTRVNGGKAADAWHAPQAGFRSDWDLSAQDTLTFEGDILAAREGQTITTPFSNALPRTGTFDERMEMNTGNIMGRWNHILKNGSETELQVYDDYSRRLDEGLRATVNSVDMDFQHHLAVGSRQDVVWGLSARVSVGNYQPGVSITFVPPHRTDTLFSTFVQDEVKITDTVRLSVGSKFEHNSFTGFEVEPSAQLVWTPTVRQALWVSGARAVRQPSATDTAIQADVAVFPAGSLPGVLRLFGNPNVRAEKLNDVEAGYRRQLNKRISVDVAAFASFYHDLLSSDIQPPHFVPNGGSPYLLFPLLFHNQARAHSYGGELSLNWNVTNRWRLSPGYSMLDMVARSTAPGGNATVEQLPGYNPKHQYEVRSWLTLPHRFEWDSSVAYIGALATGNIPSYTRLDSRFGWRVGESVEFSIVGQNLLTPRHAEFPDEYGLNHTLIERAVFGKITWRF